MGNVAAERIGTEAFDRASKLRQRALSLVPGATACVAVVGLCSAQGGFFSTSWGWAALGFCWLAALAIVLPRTVRLGTPEIAALTLLFLFTGWVGLSTLWSSSVSQSMLELERDLIYPLGVAAVLLVARTAQVAELLAGVLAGIVGIAAYALGTRLLEGDVSASDVAGLRLANPIGYWNGLGIVCALGALLAVAFAAHGRSLVTRTLAPTALLVLVPSLYFTFSRGSWLSLALGMIAAVLIDTQRLRLVTAALVVAPWIAAAVALAARSHALTTTGSSLPAARHEGHRLALEIVLLALGAAATALAVGLVERRWAPAPSVRRLYAGALVVAVLIGASVAFVHYGGPVKLARKAYDSFTSPPITAKQARGFNLNNRLFSLSSNGRIDLWKAAWHEASAHPLQGGGAGTYGSYWLEHRHTNSFVQDAHSLYAEQLAELGAVGLVLLLGAMLVPVAAGFRARRQPLVPVALGAYVAFLVHQGVDWDFELSGVTLAGLLVGAAILVAARERSRTRALLGWRWALLAVVLAVAGFSFVGLIGNRYLAQSTSDASAGKYAQAAARARQAIDWSPWAGDPWRALGLAQVGLGQRSRATSSFRQAVRKDPDNWSAWATLLTHSTGATARHAHRVLVRLDPLDYR